MNRKHYSCIYAYLLPIALQAVAYFTTTSMNEFVTRTIAITVAGYLIAGVGAGVYQFWKWNVPFAIAGLPVHIGFLYSAYINATYMLVYQVFHIDTFAFAVLFTLCFVLIGFIHDVIGIHFGWIIVYNRAFKRNIGSLAIASEYAPMFFGLLAVLFIFTDSVFLRATEKTVAFSTIAWRATSGGIAIAFPFLVFFFYSHQKKISHKTKRRNFL